MKEILTRNIGMGGSEFEIKQMLDVSKNNIILLYFRMINLRGQTSVVHSANGRHRKSFINSSKSKNRYGIEYSLFKFIQVQFIFEQDNIYMFFSASNYTKLIFS